MNRSIKTRFFSLNGNAGLQSKFLYKMLVVAFSSMGLYSLIWIHAEFSDFKSRSKTLRAEYVAARKEMLKTQVGYAVSYIETLQKHAEEELKLTLKNQVNQVHQPFDRYLGAGAYLDDFEIRFQKMVIERLADLRFGREGYFFGSTYQGDPLFSNGRVTTGSGSIWDVTDPNGVKIIQEQSRAAQTPDGGFVSYAWSKLGTETLSMKISYVRGIDTWQWTIGAGVYLDTIEATIQKNKARFYSGLKKRVVKSVAVLFLLLCLIYFWSRRISHQIGSSIKVLMTCLKQAETESSSIDTNQIQLKEFKEIAISTNNMLHKRQEAEKAREKSEKEQRKLQEQLAQSQKMETVGRLAGGVAHDFNNMLGVILGRVEIMLDQVENTHYLHHDIIEIQQAAQRSADLTRQLLTFARKQVISPEPIDLNSTVKQMLKMLERLIGENITLNWKPAHSLWPVKMDRSQVDQILVNLCVNARQAITKVGRITIETKMTTWDAAQTPPFQDCEPGDYVQLVFSDNGCGMDDQTLGNLFEPFFTTRDVGQGTGLGLATVYGIVKQNNGCIMVDSEPDRGTTFTIYLPRYTGPDSRSEPQPETAGAASQAAENLQAAVDRGHETILLVEDQVSILNMAKIMLERQGYKVLPAATPAEAMDLAETHPRDIHLMLTDVIMPEMNGRDLARKITALYPDIKLLFMSGYTADVIAHQGKLDNGVAFIQKPFSMADLTEKLRQILDPAADKTLS
ncbi:MAG: cache domain-containing protein [Desulfobacteraceae bacterium]